MAARRVTYLEYLEWAALRPRTNDWSALVAYDRDKCNHLLRQEYIEKFDNNSYLLPIDDTYATGETTWFWLKDYLTDAARLSYENNPDGNGGNVAEANMSMAVVGGTEIELYGNSGGGTEVMKISSFDPLDHPELKADRVQLKDIIGQVDQGGSVVLDLGDPAAQRYMWELTGSRFQEERRIGGAYLKRKFREAELARRTYKLGQLAYTDQEFLKPAKFKMRTVMEAGANNRSAANFGNGALELRIAMKGELEGGFPGDDWLYPIPSDLPGVDSSLMLSSKLLMHQILGGGAARAFEVPKALFDERRDEKGFVKQVDLLPTEGSLHIPESERYVVGGGELKFRSFQVPAYIDPSFCLSVAELAHSAFHTHIDVDIGNVEAKIRCGVWISNDPRIKEFELGVRLGGEFLFSMSPDGRKIVLEADNFYAFVAVTNLIELPQWVVPYIESPTSEFNQAFMRHCKSAFSSSLNNVLGSVDVFVLNSLLFNSTDAVQLKTVDLPGDLISFGSISPRLTTFAIDPTEKLLGYAATHTFTTNPVMAGVKWSVSNLDGSTAGAGQIDANTGRYTAPGQDQIGGTYKRVKVTATGAGSAGKPHVSKALVTIAARAVTLNPLVQTCKASGAQLETRQFTANSLSGTLKWSVIGGGSVPENANPDRTNLYTAPPKQDVGDTKRTFTVDEVKVTNTTTQQNQSSFVVVTHDKQNLVMAMKLEGANKAKFSATFNGQDPAPTWDLFPKTGAGSIDSSGLYTADPNSHYQFVIITARAAMGDFFLGDAFFIQPLPLAVLPPKPDPEIPQRSLDGMPQV